MLTKKRKEQVVMNFPVSEKSSEAKTTATVAPDELLQVLNTIVQQNMSQDSQQTRVDTNQAVVASVSSTPPTSVLSSPLGTEFLRYTLAGRGAAFVRPFTCSGSIQNHTGKSLKLVLYADPISCAEDGP